MAWSPRLLAWPQVACPQEGGPVCPGRSGAWGCVGCGGGRGGGLPGGGWPALCASPPEGVTVPSSRQGEHEQEQGTVEREDTKDKSQERGRKGEEEKTDTAMELGQEHPGKLRTGTGTSEGQRPWTGTSEEETAMDWNVRGCIRRRTRRRQETVRRTSTRARNVEREDKKKKSRGEGGEGEEGEAGKHMKPGLEH